MSPLDQLLNSLTARKTPAGEPAILTDADLVQLIQLAECSGDCHPATWAKLARVLEDLTDLKVKQARQLFRECRIRADLGTYPHSVEDFIPAFLTSRGYRMNFDETFNSADLNFILNQMKIWSAEIVGAPQVFHSQLIEAAFQNWTVGEKDRLRQAAYQSVKFDPGADATELTRFVEFILAPSDGGDPERDIRAAEVALRNFIYRVKNHMRRQWRHGVHMMPIFFGPQGSGKTTMVRHLISPLEQFSAGVGFDVITNDSKMFQLSVIPIMFFDELAGISKADNERLKDIMHTQSRQLKQLYQSASNRVLVSTFIGCTNKDISTLIRDETGNRRYYQIEAARRARADILKFDAGAMWRSVDEDGEPPLYALAADLDAVLSAQAEQRHFGKVEHWVEQAERQPRDFVQSSELFTNYYVPWLQSMYPGQDRFENVVTFGKELTRLSKLPGSRVQAKFAADGRKVYHLKEEINA